MRTEKLDYQAGGKTYTGLLAVPDQPNGGAVLVAHSAVGQSAHERSAAQRLAEFGYVALAVDYYGGGCVLTGDALAAATMPIMQDHSLLRTPMLGGLEALKAQAGVDPALIAVIGYCMGGAAAFELAMTGADVKAAVGFHSILPIYPPEQCKAIKGAVLMQQGAHDPFVPTETRLQFEKTLNEAGVDWRVLVYGGAEHAFTMKSAATMNRPGIVYHEPTDKRSWRAMLDVLGETVGRA